MKKVIVFILSLILITFDVPISSFAENISIDVPKLVYNGKEYIPLRDTFEGLGYKVTWIDQIKTVEIEKENNTVHVRANENYMLRNGVLINGVFEPIIINGRMFLSLQSVEELFNMYWFLSSNEVRVYDVLKNIDENLPKLKSKLEYDKLISFYPNQNEYYMGLDDSMILEDMVVPGVEEKMAEESQISQPNTEISNTNIQVEGVDEADIVKIDKNYIYSIKGQEVQIIRAGRGKLKILRTLKEEGFYPEQLFITTDKLILIGRNINTTIKTYEEENKIITMPVYKQSEMLVKCYDKKNLEFEDPKLIKSFGIEGHYISSRMVDNFLYIIANKSINYEMPIMPMLTQTDENMNAINKQFNYDEISYFPGHVNNSMFYTMGIDLDNLSMDGLDVDAYIGGGNNIYADMDTLYVSLRSNSGMWWRNSSETTDIYSFSLNNGKINPKAKGNVPGYIINQFAMDEYDGYFRIATTSWGSEDVTRGNTSLNNLYILDEDLKLTGSIQNLAPGEQIYSTRMIKDKVYIVTYRQIDPFYVIDTSNPSNPLVLGYLKIPGYSSYLHPYNDKIIIGIGIETKLEGNRVISNGVKISLFDVSDFSNPIEKDKIVLGTTGSNSDVGYDHKAFLFNLDKNIMAIPASVVNASYSVPSKDAYIFSFTKDDMLNLRGVISHASFSQNEKIYFDYNNAISRIMYVGNDLYTLSNNWIGLNDFDTLKSIDSLKR